MNGRVSRAPVTSKDQTVASPDSAEGNLPVLSESEEGKSLVPGPDEQDMVLVRRWLRDSIDTAGWKDAAVAEHIGLSGPNGAAYFSKMLSGEKPIGAKHLRALPDEIERLFAQKYAEHFGLIVVAPLRGEDAIKGLVAGLVGALSLSLRPRMARASLPAGVLADRRRA